MKKYLDGTVEKRGHHLFYREYEVTGWFFDELPSRPGLYQIHMEQTFPFTNYQETPLGWCWFDGERWAWAYNSKRDALFTSKDTNGTTQKKVWRGCIKNYAV
jgi:hypothetical protein